MAAKPPDLINYSEEGNVTSDISLSSYNKPKVGRHYINRVMIGRWEMNVKHHASRRDVLRFIDSAQVLS